MIDIGVNITHTERYHVSVRCKPTVGKCDLSDRLHLIFNQFFLFPNIELREVFHPWSCNLLDSFFCVCVRVNFSESSCILPVRLGMKAPSACLTDVCIHQRSWSVSRLEHRGL